MKKMLALCCLILFFVTVFQASAQEGQLVDGVIAIVDDEIILESEVLQYVQDIVVRNPQQYNSEAAISELRANVLQELINQKILLAVALDDTNVVVEEREIDQVLDDRISQLVDYVGSEEELEEYYGKPIRQIRREFRQQVEESLLVDRLRMQRLSNISASRDEVQEFFHEYREDLPQTPQRVHLAHILLSIEPSEEATAVAQGLADSLYNRLLLGDDFETLAMEFSDDRASGARGGLLGATERGDFVPEFEEIAYNLEEGEISSPIQSRFGLHIIRLNWRRGERINTSHILINLAPTDADAQRVLVEMREIRQQILDGEATFADMAREYSQDEETANVGGDLGWFDAPQMPNEFRIVARDLEQGEISEPFRTRFGIHIMELTERQEERAINLRSDWERISQMASNYKRDQVYSEWVEELKEDVYVEILER